MTPKIWYHIQGAGWQIPWKRSFEWEMMGFFPANHVWLPEVDGRRVPSRNLTLYRKKYPFADDFPIQHGNLSWLRPQGQPRSSSQWEMHASQSHTSHGFLLLSSRPQITPCLWEASPGWFLDWIAASRARFECFVASLASLLTLRREQRRNPELQVAKSAPSSEHVHGLFKSKEINSF